ncbi:MAG: sigma-70 family RNA polymerase sigma factor [Candidatus Zixiibacteriota bacterium]
MATQRIIYQNWIAELGRDPSVQADDSAVPWPDILDPDNEAAEILSGSDTPDDAEGSRRELIRSAVRAAIETLSDDEREIVEQVHFMGRTIREIAERSGRSGHRLEAMHQRALRKLRRKLAPLVAKLFGVASASQFECPICQSPHREEIDHIIRERNPDQTWRPVLRRIRDRFGLRLTTPQILIGHEKYH